MRTPQQERKFQLGLEFVNVVLQAIQDHGINGVPSGYVYAAVMGLVSLDSYLGVINLLERHKKVRVANHVIYALDRTPLVVN